MKYPQTFENLINGLKKLPGVGSKSAERMAYQILNMDDEDISKLATSLLDSKEKITDTKLKCIINEMNHESNPILFRYHFKKDLIELLRNQIFNQ